MDEVISMKMVKQGSPKILSSIKAMRTRAKLVRINFFVPFPIPGHLSCRMPNLNCQSIVFIEFLFTTCINKSLWTHGIHLKCVIQRKYNIPQWGENWCLDCLPPKPTTQCICNYLLPHTHTHLYIHVHTHGAKRTDNGQQREHIFEDVKQLGGAEPDVARWRTLKAEGLERACQGEAGSTKPKSSSGILGIRHPGDGGESGAENRICWLLPSPCSPHPQQSDSHLSHIPVGNRGFHLWGDCARDLDSGAPGTVRTAAFT